MYNNFKQEPMDQEELPLERQLLERKAQPQKHQQQRIQGEQKPNKQLTEQQVKQLKMFERSKISLNRFAADVQQDNIKLGQSLKFEEEIQFIPCPFCAVPLMLHELEHINCCQDGIECFYCKEKYPKFLYGSHLLVCYKRIDHDANLKKKIPAQPISSKKILPKEQKLQRPNEKKVQVASTEAQIKPLQPREQMQEQKPQVQHQQQKVNPSKQLKKVVKQQRKQHRKVIIFQRKQQPQGIKKNVISQKKDNKQKLLPANNKIMKDNLKIQAPKKAYQYDLQSRIRKQQNKGLQQYQIDQIQIEYYNNIKEEHSQCSICTMQIGKDQQVIRLACTHFFHADCLKPWLLTRSRCPICKSMISL